MASKYGGIPVSQGDDTPPQPQPQPIGVAGGSKYGGIPVNAESVPVEPASSTGPETGLSDYLLDQVKAEGGALAENVIPYFAQSLLTGGKLGHPLESFGEERTMRELKQEERNRENVLAETLFGYEGIEPKNEMERYLGIGARGFSDPMNIVGVGGTTIPRKLISAGMEYLYGGVTQMVGAATSEISGQVAADIGLGETGQDIASEVSAVIAGGVLNAGRTVSGRLADKAVDLVVATPELKAKAEDLLSNAEVKAVIANAADAEGGTLQARIKTATELMEAIPGLVIPTAAAAGSNPIINKNFAELYAKYPAFRATYDKAQKQAITILEGEMSKAKGVPTDSADLRNKIDGYANNKKIEADSVYRKRKAALDKRLDAVADKLTSKTDAAEIGREATGILKAVEKAAQESVKPHYEAAFKAAENNGIELPATSVATVYKTIKDLNAADIFATFPGLTEKIKKVWSPKKSSGFDYSQPGPARKKTSMEVGAVSVRDADSLKRAINKALRESKDPGHSRVLGHLKEVLAGEVAKLPPEFSVAYKEADNLYAQRLGIPRGQEGVKSLSKARFETSVGTQLNKYDQARDYLGMVGETGIPVVRSSILLAAERAGAIKADGEIDTKVMSRFLRRNGATIDLVPGLSRELTDIKNLADTISNEGARIESEFKATSARYSEGFYGAVHNKNLDKVAGEMIEKPATRKQYLAEISKMPSDVGEMAMNGVRQAVLNKAVYHKGTMFEYVTQNKDAFSDVFGKSYMKDLEIISKAYDVISVMNTGKVGSARDFKDEDRLKQVTGVTIPETVGMLRNQILSPQRKAINLLSKMFLRKSATKRDKALMDLMVDPRYISKLSDAAANVEKAALADGGKALNTELSKFFHIMQGRIVKGVAQAQTGLNEAKEEETYGVLRDQANN